MNRYLEGVKKFHDTFELPVNNLNDNIDLKVRQLRINLLFEELVELAHATGCLETLTNLCKKNQYTDLDTNNVDKKEELDALVDIQYVLCGAVLSLGHHEHFDSAFEDVQTSNMSKMCNNIKEVEDTINMYIEKHNMSRDEISYKQKDSKYIVYRLDDNKILKNKYYQSVDLSKYLN